MYITESVPAFLRGSILAITIFVSNFGGLLGVIVNNFTQSREDKLSYQIPMFMLYLAPLVVGVLLFFIPDTPRYYIMIDQPDKAAQAIRKLRGPNISEAMLGAEIEEMRANHEADQQAKGELRLLDIFRGTDLRRTLIMYLLSVMQVATGRGFLSQYSVYFLAQARISDPFLWVMVTYIISLTGNAICSVAMRYAHRKTLLIPGLLSMGIAMLVMAVTHTVQGETVSAGRVLIAMYVLHTWLGSALTMPSAAAISSEVASQRARPQMTGTSSIVLFGLSWLISYTTPYFINPEQLGWGPKYAYIWAGSCAVLAVAAWLFVPETMGRSLEQIDELFEKHVSARKFRGHEVESRNIDEMYEQQDDLGAEDETEATDHSVEREVETKVVTKV